MTHHRLTHSLTHPPIHPLSSGSLKRRQVWMREKKISWMTCAQKTDVYTQTMHTWWCRERVAFALVWFGVKNREENTANIANDRTSFKLIEFLSLTRIPIPNKSATEQNKYRNIDEHFSISFRTLAYWTGNCNVSKRSVDVCAIACANKEIRVRQFFDSVLIARWRTTANDLFISTK